MGPDLHSGASSRTPATTAHASDTHGVPARALLFGYESSPVTISIRPRARRWRVGGALRIAGTALVLAPAAALVPPHAPWAFGALVAGGLLARRRLRERYTVEGVTGACPRCQGVLAAVVGPLRSPHPGSCESCHSEVTLTLDRAVLPDPEAGAD